TSRSQIVEAWTWSGCGNAMRGGRRGLAARRRACPYHDGSRRLLFATAEIADIRHDDMDASGSHAADLLDGAADLTFQGPNTGHFLHEGGQAQRTDIVEQFVAGIGAVRQAAFGKQDTRLAGLADRHLNT